MAWCRGEFDGEAGPGVLFGADAVSEVREHYGEECVGEGVVAGVGARHDATGPDVFLHVGECGAGLFGAAC
ncbi:hypothetical protein I6A62_08910 [Frankia sp. AgW1.1]|nr:hypothetical protein [Frankia sp. AgW1.1]